MRLNKYSGKIAITGNEFEGLDWGRIQSQLLATEEHVH
jgi:hypothetical protein